MRCEAVLRTELHSENGWPRMEDVHCGQTVGVSRFYLVRDHYFCARHFDDVLTQANREFLHQRVWHDHEEGRLNEYQQMRLVRPEARR
jgi:hypothetical protein